MGDLLLLVTPGLEPLTADWLEELVSRMADPGIGAAAPVLLANETVVATAGRTLAMNRGTQPRFEGHSLGNSGYGELLKVAHEVSAVDANALLTRSELFRELKGFNLVAFREKFADVDYCLRLRSRGFRIVVTPDAILRDHRSDQSLPGVSERAKRDLVNLQALWGEELSNDRFYSPLLGLDDAPYSALAWPPRSFEARLPRVEGERSRPPGF